MIFERGAGISSRETEEFFVWFATSLTSELW